MTYDTIIIGGGPAGLTAGIYLARAGKKILILEKSSIGGQIASSYKIENYPGMPSISGMEFSSNLYDQVLSFGGEIDIATVVKIEDGKIKKVYTEDDVYEAKSLIISTGVEHNRLGLANEEALIGRGVHYCATCDGAFYKDKVVAVVGGANTAATDALFLSDLCSKVYLIYRKSTLRCEKTLQEEILAKPNIEVLYNTTIEKLNGEEELESIEILTGERVEVVPISGLFLAIGSSADAKLKIEGLKLDQGGYFDSEDTITDLKGIFVAGDCRKKDHRQLTTAVSDGTDAALNAIEYLKDI